MRILITGSDGEIGREIAYQLSKNQKYNLNLLSNKKINRKKFNFFYQNLLKPIKLKLKPHAIIHCAGKHTNSKSGSNMKNIYSINMKITKNLIKFANKNNVSIIFFLSSIAVYGSINQDVIFESQNPINTNLYEKSKFLSEKLFCNENNKFNTICLRMPGVFTLNLNKDYPLIIKILKKIINNENVQIYNSNNKFNNILDVNEIVRFINFALRKKKVLSGIYNFSASSPIKFIHAIQLIKKIFGSKSKIINKKSSTKSFIISNKKILNDLNFKTSTTKKIISRCCNNILDKNYDE